METDKPFIVPKSVRDGATTILEWVEEESAFDKEKINPAVEFLKSLLNQPNYVPDSNPNVVATISYYARGCSYSASSAIPLSQYLANLYLKPPFYLGEIAGKHSNIEATIEDTTVRFSLGDVDDVLEEDFEQWSQYKDIYSYYHDCASSWLEDLEQCIEETLRNECGPIVDRTESVQSYLERLDVMKKIDLAAQRLRRKLPLSVDIIAKSDHPDHKNVVCVHFDSPIDAAWYVDSQL